MFSSTRRAMPRGQRAPSRHEALCDALEPHRDAARVVVFNDSVVEVKREKRLPDPCGGTDLAMGVRYVTTLEPARTILISDGEPNSSDAAFAAAEKLPGILDTIFVGDDNDEPAKQFMRDLATRCGGEFCDLATSTEKELAPVLARYLLPA